MECGIPPSPRESKEKEEKSSSSFDTKVKPPSKHLSREEIRFLADIVARPLSTTVSRYQKLNPSRRRGNAVRQHLTSAGVIERIVIPTRSSQVVLYRLTDSGRAVCSSIGIKPGPRSRESLEHGFWVNRTARYFEKKGYDVACEHPVKGNGAVDILAKKPGQAVAIEVETGKSKTQENLNKVKRAGFDRVILLATSPVAVAACGKAIDSARKGSSAPFEMLTWLDIS